MLSIVGSKEVAGRGVRFVARVELLIDFRELRFGHDDIGEGDLDHLSQSEGSALSWVIMRCLGLQLDWKKGALLRPSHG